MLDIMLQENLVINMGGRGSNSGINRKANTNSEGNKGARRAAIDRNMAQTAKMPDLKGSEKQVKWAESIRNELLESADYLVLNAIRNEELNSRIDTAVFSVQAALEVREDIIKTMQNINSASRIIDQRRNLTYDSIKRMALHNDYVKGRRKSW